MINYIPFLKLKVNEVGAVKMLSPDIKENLIPFFDLVKKNGMSGSSFEKMVKKSAVSIASNLADISTFFLDNFDIDDNIIINKQNNYGFVIETFKEINFIPVVGLDRAVGRNQLVFDYKKKGIIQSEIIAIRLVSEDFENFALVRDEISELFEQGGDLFAEWVLIIDNRCCLSVDIPERATEIADFLDDSCSEFEFQSIIITGSSIPSSIKDIVGTESDVAQARSELDIYVGVSSETDGLNLILGDYTIVSPLYSDVDIPPEMMMNVMAPKVVYTHGRVHYVVRGGALKSHARGNLQYNDIAGHIIAQPFYRGGDYSFGDEFLYDKAHFNGKNVTPSSILKPTINTHITYMVRDFIA